MSDTIIHVKGLTAKVKLNNGEMLTTVNNVEFSMVNGKSYAIVGKSGSGKTSLVSVLGLLNSSFEGEYFYENKLVNSMSDKSLSKLRSQKLGFVFQSYNLTPDLTVRENIEMTAELVQEPLSTDTLIEELGLKKYETHFPKELSGGQQQRVAIARAMVKKPDILLCDELTGALDTKSSKDVLQRVQKMNDTYKTTVVIITHNLNIAGMADRIIKITDGKVVSNQKNVDKKRVEEMEL